MVRPERREHAGRYRIGGTAADHDVVAVLFDGDLRFLSVGIAEHAFMQIGGVAEVEQVVDDELIIGVDDDRVALGGVQFRHVVEG